MTPRRPRGHAQQSPPRPVIAGVLTVSDTRRGADDTGGALAERLLTTARCVVTRAWVKDDVTHIRAAVRSLLRRKEVDLLVVTGGTGVAPRDVTPDAIEPLLDRALPGFGERFRALSAGSVGSAAWLSRAGAGIARGRLVVYLPGSPGAVQDALEQLLLPELAHALRLLGRFD